MWTIFVARRGNEGAFIVNVTAAEEGFPGETQHAGSHLNFR